MTIRHWITLCEAVIRPSPALIAAAKAWVEGWSPDKRHKAEEALWAVRQEASQFTTHYGKLYRGTRITDDQYDALERGETIRIEMPRLASWTTVYDIAHDYHEDGNGILITKSDGLKPIFDVALFLDHFADDFGQNARDVPRVYHLCDAGRRGRLRASMMTL